VPTRIRLNWPNRISLARLLLIGPFVVCLLNMRQPHLAWLRWAAVGIFGLMAISDFVDGYIARRTGQVTELGKYLDPLADKLLVTITVVFLVVRGVTVPLDDGTIETRYLPNYVAVAAIGKDLIVLIGFLVVYISTGRVFIEARRLGKWCTTVQLVLVLSMLVWVDLPGLLGHLPRVLWIAATALAVLAALDYIRVGSRFIAASPSARETRSEEPHS